ncbi:MAG: hypothetical protein K8T91_23880 [Planctomycetes bacterium]|nr:hypothetical protein [Planctomycetota bacterium]
MNDDAYQIEIDSQLFHRLCEALEKQSPDVEATSSLDGMSGGFKFSDEFPCQFKNDEEALFPCISLLRTLWAYRQSLVMRQPRIELANWWEVVLKLAPHWPGFLPERTSSEMLELALQCEAGAIRLTEDLDKLDNDLEQERRRAMGQPHEI